MEQCRRELHGIRGNRFVFSKILPHPSSLSSILLILMILSLSLSLSLLLLILKRE
jgi:hypothetical protein